MTDERLDRLQDDADEAVRRSNRVLAEQHQLALALRKTTRALRDANRR